MRYEGEKRAPITRTEKERERLFLSLCNKLNEAQIVAKSEKKRKLFRSFVGRKKSCGFFSTAATFAVLAKTAFSVLRANRQVHRASFCAHTKREKKRKFDRALAIVFFSSRKKFRSTAHTRWRKKHTKWNFSLFHFFYFTQPNKFFISMLNWSNKSARDESKQVWTLYIK